MTDIDWSGGRKKKAPPSAGPKARPAPFQRKHKEIDRPRTIKDEWESYLAAATGAGRPPKNEDEVHMAFYAGAHIMKQLLANLPDDDGEADRQLLHLTLELVEFQDIVRFGRL